MSGLRDGEQTIGLAVVPPGEPPLLAARGGRQTARAHGFGLVAWIGLVLFVLLLLGGILAPLLPIDDPLAQTLALREAGPSIHHLLGTDLDGRDVLSRIVYGSRSAFEGVGIGVLAMLILGVPWGLAAGFCGTAVDEILMRLADALLSFPALLLAIGVVSVLGPSMFHSMAAVGVISAPGIARLLRAEVLPIRNSQFVQIARSLGVSGPRIAIRHVLPNAMMPIIVQTFAVASYFLIIEAALGFLGLGVPPPAPSWGQDLANAYATFASNPFATVVPGIAITLGAWSINATGDGLRELLTNG
ncbi:MAG TPA: ABC transporter permease [Solirubrobacteraceae bacterium]|nr:ABC transporter permease [Solirubrobacteraceae bacterium]